MAVCVGLRLFLSTTAGMAAGQWRPGAVRRTMGLEACRKAGGAGEGERPRAALAGPSLTGRFRGRLRKGRVLHVNGREEPRRGGRRTRPGGPGGGRLGGRPPGGGGDGGAEGGGAGPVRRRRARGPG